MIGQAQMTPAVKNLLIINVLCFAATYVIRNSFGIDLHALFGLHYCASENFYLWQFVTYMFMHDGIYHIFFNMFSVYMFGRALEMYWGTKRFLVFYFVTGVGAGIVQEVTYYYQATQIANDITSYLNNQTEAGFYTYIAPYVNSRFIEYYNNLASTCGVDELARIMRQNVSLLQDEYVNHFNTVGASGACFGLLLAFGMMFPNMVIMLLIPPIPIKAKYFVMIYGLIELFEGVHNFQYDNVAHWAHLGGMLFGFFLIRKWQKEGTL